MLLYKVCLLVGYLKTDLDKGNGFDCAVCHIAIQRLRVDMH